MNLTWRSLSGQRRIGPTWLLFVRADPATRKPQDGDVWIQLLTLTSEAHGNSPRLISELDSDLEGKRDVIILFHVEEFSRTILGHLV